MHIKSHHVTHMTFLCQGRFGPLGVLFVKVRGHGRTPYFADVLYIYPYLPETKIEYMGTSVIRHNINTSLFIDVEDKFVTDIDFTDKGSDMENIATTNLDVFDSEFKIIIAWRCKITQIVYLTTLKSYL